MRARACLHVESCLCEILDVDKEMSRIVEALVAGKGKGKGKGKGARANRTSVNFSSPLGLESLLKSINIWPCLQVYQIVCSIENWLAQNCRGRDHALALDLTTAKTKGLQLNSQFMEIMSAGLQLGML